MQLEERYRRSKKCLDNLERSLIDSRHFYVRNRKMLEEYVVEGKPLTIHSEVSFITWLTMPDGTVVIKNSEFMDRPLIQTYDYSLDSFTYNNKTMKHRHDFVELGYVYFGTYKIQADDKIYEFHKGDIFFIDSLIEHEDLASDKECFVVFIRMKKEFYMNIINSEFDEEFVYNFNLKVYDTKNFEQLIVKLPYSEQYNREYHLMMESMINEIEVKRVGWKHIFKGYLVRGVGLIFEMYGDSVEPIEVKKLGDSLFDQMQVFIKSNYANISVQMLVEEFNYNADYYNRLFKKNTGKTLRDYIQKVKVNKSMELLIQTDKSIEDIVEIVGYRNKSAYYKVFKKYIGITPVEYRQR